MIKIKNKGVLFLFTGLLFLVIAVGWFICNVMEDRSAGKKSSEILDKLEVEIREKEHEENEAPVIVVEGDAFCGKVIIQKLGIELPVYDEWSYERLKAAPCRYVGSIATNDIIIAAHNYKSHFGSLNRLIVGDEVIFIDAHGIIHRYEVNEIITLDGTAISEMQSGDWDFTLFTCTRGGEQRVTVRCNQKK